MPKDSRSYCLTRLVAADELLESLACSWLPGTLHNARTLALAEHFVTEIQELEKHIAGIRNINDRKQLLDEVMFRRSIFYDLIDLVKLKEVKDGPPHNKSTKP